MTAVISVTGMAGNCKMRASLLSAFEPEVQRPISDQLANELGGKPAPYVDFRDFIKF